MEIESVEQLDKDSFLKLRESKYYSSSTQSQYLQEINTIPSNIDYYLKHYQAYFEKSLRGIQLEFELLPINHPKP
jgi:hypothetical protein